MSNPSEADPISSIREYQEQCTALRAEVTKLRAERQLLWPLLTEVSRRLQLASASIKVAVSSLLNYDIFWDGSNQQEFLATIETSVDQVGQLVQLLALGSRAAADSLELKIEPHMLQEIISAVQTRLVANSSERSIGVSLPQDGSPVLVDYEYLVMSVEFILRTLDTRASGAGIEMHATEGSENWSIDLKGLDSRMIELIVGMPTSLADDVQGTSGLPAESILRLYIAKHVLTKQGIVLETQLGAAGEVVLHMTVPALIVT